MKAILVGGASQTHSKILVLRLSSLGDVILSTTVLEVPNLPPVDWVVAAEFAEVLRGHPRVQNLYPFDRKLGLRGWVRLGHQLWKSQYSEVWDLHCSLRTRVLQLLFSYWGFRAKISKKTRPQWRVISKQRFRLWLYFLLKGLHPRFLRPDPWVQRYSKFAGGSGRERPQLRHLLSLSQFQGIGDSKSLPRLQTRYLCVMPSSKWNGKKWPVAAYVQALKKIPLLPVILGTRSDLESQELCRQLAREGVDYLSGVGQWNLSETARVLDQAEAYLGNDTGIAHLAEALGVPAFMIFGPTTPEMGFGPWKKESQAIGKPVVCRPCSKDGRVCYRVVRRYQCLKSVTPNDVVQSLSQKLCLKESPLGRSPGEKL